jgi:HAD superfamily hydrolase (TIGR01509 family)
MAKDIPTDALRGALLDVDGTLIDSNAAHARAWSEALREAGVWVSVDRLRWLIGMGGDKILPQVASIDADSALGRRLGARRQQLFQQRHLPHCEPQPGARALLRRLSGDGLRCIVASSAQAEELTPLLHRAGVADLIDAAATSGDAEESKPDPDIVQAALRRGGIAAHQAVMLGDTPYDVEAALRAGVPIIALRCGGWDAASLAGAVAVYDDPADLLRNFADSPFAGRVPGSGRRRGTAAHAARHGDTPRADSSDV